MGDSGCKGRFDARVCKATQILDQVKDILACSLSPKKEEPPLPRINPVRRPHPTGAASVGLLPPNPSRKRPHLPRPTGP